MCSFGLVISMRPNNNQNITIYKNKQNSSNNNNNDNDCKYAIIKKSDGVRDKYVFANKKISK